MVVLLRRLFFFLLQLSGITAAVVVGCAAWALSERGMSYAETLAFRDDLERFPI